jgi:hypothetical protein
MNRFVALAVLLLLGACSAAPYSYDTSTDESAAEHGGGPGPGNVPINPSSTSPGP